MSQTIVVSPDCPRTLKRLYRRLRSTHQVATELGVNVSHVYAALTEGICPANPSIAAKLGFDARHLRLGDERTRHVRWWRRLSPQQRNKLIFDWYHYREDDRKSR